MPVPSYPAVPATGYQPPAGYPPTTGYPRYPAYPPQAVPGQAPLPASVASGGYTAPSFPSYPPQQTAYHQTGEHYRFVVIEIMIYRNYLVL